MTVHNLTSPINCVQAQDSLRIGTHEFLAIASFTGAAMVLDDRVTVDGQQLFWRREGLPVLDANNIAPTCIQTTNGNRSDIRRLWLQNATGAGLALNKGEGTTVDHCNITDCDVGIISRGDNASTISGCTVTGGTHGLVFQEAQPGAGHLSVRGGYYQFTAGEALVADSGAKGHLMLDHVYVENPNPTGSHGVLVRQGRCSIHGGLFIGHRDTGAVAVYVGPGADRVNIYGPSLADTDGAGSSSGLSTGDPWTPALGYAHVVCHPSVVDRVHIYGGGQGLKLLTADLSWVYDRATLGA